MKFIPEKTPFPYWMGPYSPARGKAGFRIKNGQLGAWINTDEGRAFCVAQDTEGVSSLTRLVKHHWHGGRLLFLPTGIVVKPHQNEDEAGLRVVVGRYEGGLKLKTERGLFDLSNRGHTPGSEWHGPGMVGLECTIKSDGSLETSWQQPTDYGQEQYREKITRANATLTAGFKKARPYDSGGRVRVTVCGHVITNRETRDGWKAFYVGKLEASQFEKWDKWIQRR
jgi:hypothetical protein